MPTRWNCWEIFLSILLTNTNKHFLTWSLILTLSLSLSHSLSPPYMSTGKRTDQDWPNSAWAPGEEAAHSHQQNGKASWDHGKQYAWKIIFYYYQPQTYEGQPSIACSGKPNPCKRLSTVQLPSLENKGWLVGVVLIIWTYLVMCYMYVHVLSIIMIAANYLSCYF